jgi:hypothetical protein
MLMLSAALYLVLLARDRPSLVQFASLPLALSFVIRPTNSISVLVLTLYVAFRYRRYLLKYLLWSTAVVLPFLAFNFTVYHSLLSSYYLPQKVGSNPALLEALVANVASPGRGLFVFSPVLLTSVVGVFLRIRDREWRRLDSVLLAVVLLHWVAISSFGKWWAGHSYGPRFFCDVVPLLVYFTIPVFVSISGLKGRAKALGAALVSGLILVSFLIHYRGATSWDTHVWNEEPVGVDDEPSRVWDWGDLQFLRGIFIASPVAGATEDRPAGDEQRLAQDCVTPLDGILGRPQQVGVKTHASGARLHHEGAEGCPTRMPPCGREPGLRSPSHKQPRPLQDNGLRGSTPTEGRCRRASTSPRSTCRLMGTPR